MDSLSYNQYKVPFESVAFYTLTFAPFYFYYLQGSKRHIIQIGKRKKNKKYAKEQNKKSKNKYKQLQFNFYVYKST